ncbi:hypothetical protein LPICM17_300001 [Lactococcus piscium]|nr:hypothetical protein LPICM17_300001 [Lactococcus piscium]
MLLPEPDGPTMLKNSPLFISKEMSSINFILFLDLPNTISLVIWLTLIIRFSISHLYLYF